MRTPIKLALGFLAVTALVAGGIVSAHGGGFGGYFGGRAVDSSGNPVQCDENGTVGACRALLGDPCNDSMLVKDCKAALEAQHSQMEQQRQAQCVAETGNATLCAQHEGRGPPAGGPGWGRGGPEGRGPHGGRGPPPGAPGNRTNDGDADDQ
jgi:hypothetical protein